ncbi:MAG: hypothetical protein ACK4UW_19130 [Rhizobium rhizophilum]|uniref:hypothetical protein n=1 Tax=Rhizobium rhizophilum TaxID=1850373 RepID=UPI00391CD2BC
MNIELVLLVSQILPIFLGFIFCCAILLDKKGGSHVVIFVLMFASCAFLYTIAFIFSNLDMSSWLRIMGGNPYQKLALLFVLLAICLRLIRHRRCLAISDKIVELSLPVASFVISIVGYGFYFAPDSPQWVLDAGSHLILCIVVFILLILTPRDRSIELNTQFFLAFCALTALSVAVSIYEISNARAWAVYSRADGLVVYRASGLQFNPNLFGAWLGFVFLLLLRANAHAGVIYAKWCIYPLIGIGLFMSGSRGAVVLLGISAVITVLIHRSAILRSVRPYLAVGLGFAIAFGSSLIVHEGPLKALSLRWLDLPLVVMNVLLPTDVFLASSRLLAQLAGVPADSLASAGSISEAENFEIAMSGRFSGALRDNGFLAALDNGGLLAAAGVAWLFGGLAILIYKASRRVPIDLSVQMLPLFAYILLWSLQARAFQVYPIWLYVALAVVILLRDITSAGALRTLPGSDYLRHLWERSRT